MKLLPYLLVIFLILAVAIEARKPGKGKGGDKIKYLRESTGAMVIVKGQTQSCCSIYRNVVTGRNTAVKVENFEKFTG